MTTMIRAACHEIGCATYDLRESELAEIEAMVNGWTAADQEGAHERLPTRRKRTLSAGSSLDCEMPFSTRKVTHLCGCGRSAIRPGPEVRDSVLGLLSTEVEAHQTLTQAVATRDEAVEATDAAITALLYDLGALEYGR